MHYSVREFSSFFSHYTSTTEIYTLSLHDALPIWDSFGRPGILESPMPTSPLAQAIAALANRQDRKSTRLNSSHPSSSYAVFCLKKKKTRSEGFGCRGSSRHAPFSGQDESESLHCG